MNKGPAWLRERKGNQRGGGIYEEGEGERGEKGSNRWQIVQPKIWR